MSEGNRTEAASGKCNHTVARERGNTLRAATCKRAHGWIPVGSTRGAWMPKVVTEQRNQNRRESEDVSKLMDRSGKLNVEFVGVWVHVSRAPVCQGECGAVVLVNLARSCKRQCLSRW